MAILDNITAAWKLDESSGNATDSSGNGKTLTNTGTVTYAAGKINNGAVGTNTTGGYLSISDALGFTAASTNTWAFWYKRAGSIDGYIVDNITTAGDSKRLIVYESSGTLRMFANGNEVATSSLTSGTWYFIEIKKNGTSWELFVNTVSQGTTTTGGLTYGGGAGFMLLNSLYTGGSQTSSMVDIVSLWSRVITSGESTTLYNGGTGIQYPFATFTPSPMMHMMQMAGGIV